MNIDLPDKQQFNKPYIILANGQYPSLPAVLNKLHTAGTIICTDGSANKLLENGLTPNVIIGDMDSSTIDQGSFKGLYVKISDQDNTDLDKALEWCKFNSLSPLTVLGASQLREDHTIGNLILLANYSDELDINFETNEEVTLEDYIRMIKLKTAVLIACSLKMGAITAGASKIDSQLIYDFGIIIGLAFQIKDDFLDIYGDLKSFGKKIGGDIIENKKTILFHNAYLNTSTENKAILNKYFSNSYEGNIETKIKTIKQIYTDSGAKSATKNLIKDYLKQAKRKINEISIQDKKKKILLDFVDNYISF